MTHNLLAALRGKTIIIIAHRLQTVQNADQIIVLDKGRIVQQGRFSDLAASPGTFRQLWEKQIMERTGSLL